MYINGLVIMVVFLQTVLSKEKIVTEIVCENEEMYIRCPKGHTIEILSVTYGKKNFKYCYRPGLQVENCEAENSLLIVKNMCNLRQRCRLPADSYLFGDHCVGTFKYLEVSYRCLKNNNIISLLVCEQDTISFGCSEGKKLKVVNALYGRKNGLTCSTRKDLGHTTLKCDSITSLEILASKCDKFKDCSLTANNAFFGDPCIPHTYKYLEVDYLCINSETMYNVSCVDEKVMTLSCEIGYINILTALFGKKNLQYCKTEDEVKIDSTCEATGTLNIMKFKCDFKRYCHVEVSTNVFGDPCPGTAKYLEVDYDCVYVPLYTAVACEQDKLQIGCSRGDFLWIVNGFFGKRNQIQCYKPEKAVVNNTCDASNAFDIVESRCQNKNQCTVEANVQTFGDPCCYSYKYLEVDYVCKNHQRLSG